MWGFSIVFSLSQKVQKVRKTKELPCGYADLVEARFVNFWPLGDKAARIFYIFGLWPLWKL